MAEAKFDRPVPELTEREDAETLAAIDRGIKDAREGRVVSLENARRYRSVAFKIIISEEALRNLGEILDYIGTDDPDAAARFGKGLQTTARFSLRFPISA